MPGNELTSLIASKKNLLKPASRPRTGEWSQALYCDRNISFLRTFIISSTCKHSASVNQNREGVRPDL